MLVAHDDGIHNGIFVVCVLVLLQYRYTLILRDGYRTGSGIQFAKQNSQECGLACAVGTDDAVAVTGQELQVYMLEQPLAAKLHSQIADSNHCNLL